MCIAVFLLSELDESLWDANGCRETLKTKVAPHPAAQPYSPAAAGRARPATRALLEMEVEGPAVRDIAARVVAMVTSSCKYAECDDG